MKYLFYYSESTFPFAGIAASMQVGVLATEPPFDMDTLKKLPLWGDSHQAKGMPHYFGTDAHGCPVYAIWNAGSPTMVKNLISSFLEIFEIPKKNIILINSGFVDDFTSILASTLVHYPITVKLGELLIHKILNKYYDDISILVGKRNAQNLTKTTSYQIMLP